LVNNLFSAEKNNLEQKKQNGGENQDGHQA
jgi:hypothetical protein